MATILEKLFPYLMAGLLSLSLGCWLTSNYYGEKIAKVELANSQQMKAISDEAANQLSQQADKVAKAQNEISIISAKAQKDLDNAQAENETLRRDVAAGTSKLYIKSEALATCTRKTVRLSRAGKLVDATAFELTGKAGSDILDLRAGIIADRAKLNYLQHYVSLLQRNGVISGLNQSEDSEK